MESTHIVYCPRCRAATPAESNFCSKCGAPLSSDVLRPPFNPYPPMRYPQPSRPAAPPKKSLKWWQIVLIVLGSVALGLYIFGRVGSMIVLASRSHRSTAYSITASSGTTGAGNDFKTGQTRTSSEGAEITIKKVERSYGDLFIGPTRGNEYIVVTIEITNKSKDYIPYSENLFKLQSGTNDIRTVLPTSFDRYSRLNSGLLKPGEAATGVLIYEEPKGQTGLTLLFFPDSLAKETEFSFELN